MSNTATTTISADDVRRWMMEPFCVECNGPRDGKCANQRHFEFIREALWTRCPGCQPEGLKWRVSKGGFAWRWRFRGNVISIATVTDLILMSIARDATVVYRAMPESARTAGSFYLSLTLAVMSTDLHGAVAARHRLKDLENAT